MAGSSFTLQVGYVILKTTNAVWNYTLPTGLIVLQRNYLDVYPYDKWSGKEIPDFRETEEFEPTTCEIKQGQTTSPSLLTEADLVGLMDKNGIGTYSPYQSKVLMIDLVCYRHRCDHCPTHTNRNRSRVRDRTNGWSHEAPLTLDSWYWIGGGI